MNHVALWTSDVFTALGNNGASQESLCRLGQTCRDIYQHYLVYRDRSADSYFRQCTEVAREYGWSSCMCVVEHEIEFVMYSSKKIPIYVTIGIDGAMSYRIMSIVHGVELDASELLSAYADMCSPRQFCREEYIIVNGALTLFTREFIFTDTAYVRMRMLSRVSLHESAAYIKGMPVWVIARRARDICIWRLGLRKTV